MLLTLFLLSSLLGVGKVVTTYGVVKPTVFVAQKTQACPVTQATEHAAVYVANKVVKVITFGSYGR